MPKTPEKTEKEDGTIEWRLDGELHRENGPAVEKPNGTRVWFREGKQHREDGPAIEYMVKMHRFEQPDQLDRMLANNNLHDQHIDAIASMVARFHGEIQQASTSDTYGSADMVYAPVEENFVQIRERISNAHFLDQMARHYYLECLLAS